MVTGFVVKCCGHRGPYIHRETPRQPEMLITQGCLLNGGDIDQIPAFHPESWKWRLLVTWWSHSSSPEWLFSTLPSILRGGNRCTLWPTDLHAAGPVEPTHMVTCTLWKRFYVALLCTWSWTDWTGCCLETFCQTVLCFNYADNELPGVRLPEVWSKLTRSIWTRFSLSWLCRVCFPVWHLQGPLSSRFLFFGSFCLFGGVVLFCFMGQDLTV